jgi:hypothetical protein
MVNGASEQRAWLGKRLSGCAPPHEGVRLTGSWARPIHGALVWQGSGGRLRREAHVSAEQHHPQATARVSRPHGDRRRPARARAQAGQRAQAPLLLSVATLLRVRLERMRGHRDSGGPPEAAPPISRRRGDALPLRGRGLCPAGGSARRARRDRHRLHRQPPDRQCGRTQSGAAPALGGGARDPSRCRQAWL